MHEIFVRKDTTVIISIINCNRDPALWGPDSYEWKPERWLSPLPNTILEAPVPGVYSHLWVPHFPNSRPLVCWLLSLEVWHSWVVHGRACESSSKGRLTMFSSWWLLNSGFKFSQLEMSTWNLYWLGVMDWLKYTEVVLSVLLSKFRFALPSEKEIVWEMNDVSVPIVKGHPGKPMMPLNVIPL